MFTRELHRRYAGRGIRPVAFHPGNVASNFASGTTSNWRLVYGTPLRHVALTSPDKAARTLLWLANGTPGTTCGYDASKVGGIREGTHEPEGAQARWGRRAVGSPGARCP